MTATATTSVYDKYEAVIGLEVHAQLLTKSKAFCGDSTEYGAEPNTQVSVISLAHPGTLPRHNKKAIEFAIKMGLAVGSTIREVNHYARKNYFYADLPKGYQITQDKTPICTGGSVKIKLKDGSIKNVGITRIHMEEDAGKSMHDQDIYDTLVDFNRAGVPLIEVVSEPDIRSADEAYQYLTEVRKLVRYLDICDGNMEEGSLRCDANVSVRLKGAEKFGTKVEVKNMNSISNVKRAIEFEIIRQIDDLEAGKTLTTETRSFDASKGITFSMRTKEAANDYRYFPEPDLPPLIVGRAWVDEIHAQMPALPDELHNLYTTKYQLSEYDASVLTDTKEVALYFNQVAGNTTNYKAAANWVMVNVKSYLNENALDMDDFTLPASAIASLIQLIDEGKISHSAASQKVFPVLVQNPTKSPLQIAEELNILQESDSGFIQEAIKAAVAKFPEKVAEYKAGKESLLGLFMGEVMKQSKGKADPKVASQLLKEYLDTIN
ncbi:MAG: Asp-tRNA(Asn)/Glu-tRNA(Gln) amidotransferase subunit GatB [Bacteroidetes bacterium]|nr:MAG: Asp-tRNA(Asn)/Glu-tRNA(Gln) amidotransferase subunit GatB [Bacteroidota bacterium]